MSKAVKSVGRAIGKVVKGVVNTVKKVASSKIGKIILAAATVYFGGAAIMGAMGGASAGTGFLGTISGAVQGAGAGIANAWSGLTGAFTGGGFSSLGQGFTGSYGAGAGAVQSANAAAMQAANAGLTTTSAPMPGQAFVQNTNLANVSGTTTSLPGAAPGINTPFTSAPVLTSPPPPTPEPGIISRAWSGLGDYGKMAAIQGGMQIAGGALQGKAAQDQLEDQRRFDLEQQAAARDRYNQNVGTPLWGNTPPAGSEYAGPSIFAQQDMRLRQNPYANSPYVRAPQPGGLIGGSMPGFGYYPTYG